MLVLISYDVNTEMPAGRNGFVKWQRCAWTMDSACRTAYLNAGWMLHNMPF